MYIRKILGGPNTLAAQPMSFIVWWLTFYRVSGDWNKGYEDRLRLLNIHSLEYRRLYGDLVLCIQLI